MSKSGAAEARPKPKHRSFVLDLRIAAPLSGGAFGAGPVDPAAALVSLARAKGLDVIAVSGWHSGAHADRLNAAAEASRVTVCPAVDVRCRLGGCDDVVFTAVFAPGAAAADLGGYLAGIGVPASAADDPRHVADAPAEAVIEAAERRGAVVLPNRIDKTPARLSALPELVEKFGFTTFDLAYPETAALFKKRWPDRRFLLVSFSNAVGLSQVGSRVARVKLEDAGFASVRDALSRDPG